MVPQFIDSAHGRIFVLLRRAAAAEKGCVLLVPPFAEEMNKSRRQMALTAEALVEKGFSTVLLDLFGTGDSEGEFHEATWRGWKADVVAAVRWAETLGCRVDMLVGLRLGCLLAAESLADAGLKVRRSVFWQPTQSGKQYVAQFLRLRVAASMMNQVAETVGDLTALLANGQSVEVAGYSLSAALWSELERADLLPVLGGQLGDVAIVEVGLTERAELSPATQRIVAAAASRGLRVEGLRVAGEPFWSSTEIVVNPALGALTVEYLEAR
jgi:uncharacterized protein